MWLNCNLGMVNLETTFAGQWLSPRHAGLRGEDMWFSRADMFTTFSFALLWDHCGSLLVIYCDICQFCSHSFHPIEVSMGSGEYSTEFFQCDGAGWLALAWLPWLLQRQGSLMRYRPFHVIGTCFQADLVNEFKLFMLAIATDSLYN